MGEIQAATAIRILNDVANADAILLRGADSILRGETQNDIDLFTPRNNGGPVAHLPNCTVIGMAQTGPAQTKLTVTAPGHAQMAEIDVFHDVSWRGLNLVDIASLPQTSSAELGIPCLERDAEVWLTVLKNGLHGSPTPPQKLHDIVERPAFPVSAMPIGWLRSRLDRRLANAVWNAAGCATLGRLAVFRARILFLSIRFVEHPLQTPIRLIQWAIWRVARFRAI